MNRPDVIAFDLMDTVVVDPFLPTLARFGDDAGLLRQSLDASAWIDFELGLIDEPVFLARLLRRPAPRAEFTAEALRDSILGGYGFVEGMETLLEELRPLGVRLWVLSNYPSWAERVTKQLELDRFFEGYVFSYRIAARKPDAAAYRELCRLAGATADRCLLVDDRLANVDGARRLGMPGVHFEGAGALRRELAALGIFR